MDITVREYQNSDKSTLQTILEKLQDYVVATDPIQRIRRQSGFGLNALDNTLETYKTNHGKILFAENDGRVIGYCFGFVGDKQSEENLLEVIPTQLGIIEDVFVEETHRGQGVGKMLLTQMENYLKEKGCDSLWLEVFAENKEAHNAYLKMGYVDREVGMLKKLT